jgi:hypothetical protein
MKIGQAFPDLNIECLLMGTCEMTKKEKEQDYKSDSKKDIDELQEMRPYYVKKEINQEDFLKQLLKEELDIVDKLNQEIGALKYESSIQEKEIARLRTLHNQP